MPAPVELALATLLPTVSFLPPDLITLSSSLLSQSRAKAASLKAEEEIGRTYACCHIACERLKRRLNLEVGKPAPPVKPRVYDKLYKYLDGVLTMPVPRKAPRTPQTNRVKDVDGSAGKRSVIKGNGAGNRTPSEVKTPTTGTKRAREELDEQEKEVPEFVMPLARAISKSTNTSSAVPHVLVGATAAVRDIVSRSNRRATEDPPSKKRRKTPQSAKSTATEAPIVTISSSKWPALLVALYLLTVAKMKEADIEDEEMKAIRSESVEVVKTFCKERKDTIDFDVDFRKLDSNINFYILEAEDYGWLVMDWYRNVPAGEDELNDQEMDGQDALDAESEEERTTSTPKKKPYKTPLQRKEKHGGKSADGLEDDFGAAGLLQGLGTMFQPAVDWLSDEKRKDYAQWKKSMIREINAIEAKS